MNDNEIPQRRQVKRVIINEEFLTDLFDERTRIINGLPEDARFVRMMENPASMQYEFMFRSSKFEPVGEGERIPVLEITFERVPKHTTGRD